MADTVWSLLEWVIYPWRGQQKYGAEMPDNKSPPTFDPLFGFEDRKVKDPPRTTPTEMRNAIVPLQFRDYCVDYYINWIKCKKDYFPGAYMCSEDYHKWNDCLYEEKMDRYREFERERRLLDREAKKQKMIAARKKRAAEAEGDSDE